MTAFRSGPEQPRDNRPRRHVCAVALVWLLVQGSWPALVQADQDVAPPRILLDQSPRAIEYQLRRLSDDALMSVERRPDDPRFVPVYRALLARATNTAVRDEALAALSTLEKVSHVGVLLAALQTAQDDGAAGPLLRLLLAQPPAELAKERDRLTAVRADPDASPFLSQGVFAAMMLAGLPVAEVWETAGASRTNLLVGLAFLPGNPETDRLRVELVPRVAAVVTGATDDAEYVAAVTAAAALRRDGATFRQLAAEVVRARTDAGVAAAIAGINAIPAQDWPADGVAPLARAIVTRLAALPIDTRLEQADAIALADRLVATLSSGDGAELRTAVRALDVRVVRLQAIPEQVAFDLRWFVVGAGMPLQIVLVNPDAMPHNVVVSTPGSLEAVGTAGGSMPMSNDPDARPFVPDMPEVLHATRLVKQGETARLSFVAPTKPGEYIFSCTFPGHWIRMYGVMLVVDDLAAWDAAPVPPNDPMTGTPFPPSTP